MIVRPDSEFDEVLDLARQRANAGLKPPPKGVTANEDCRRRYGLSWFPTDPRAPGHRVVWVKRHRAPKHGPWPILLSWRCRCGTTRYLIPPEPIREEWVCHVLVALDGAHGGPDAPQDQWTRRMWVIDELFLAANGVAREDARAFLAVP